MVENSGSKDRSLETLDFIINVLREHEKNLDKTIDELSNVVEQVAGTAAGLKAKVEESEERINNLQKDLTNLISDLSSAPKEVFPHEVKQKEPQIQVPSAFYSATIQGDHGLILRCNQWSDFQDLAMHAQKLSFTYKEDEKVLQTSALTRNQIIMYEGALPNLSMVLKKWLSIQLDVNEQNILEGFLDKL